MTSSRFAPRPVAVVCGLIAAILCSAFVSPMSNPTRVSFDRQVVGADVFIIGVGVGGRAQCSPDDRFQEICSPVRVVQVLKGEAPSEIALSGGFVAGMDSGCCEAGRIYAMALKHRGGDRYESQNTGFSIYDLGRDWTAGSAVPTIKTGYRPMTFDQQVVDADIFVVARRTGEPHPCRVEALFERVCVSFSLIQTMKGEIPETFEVPAGYSVLSLDTMESSFEAYGYAEAGGVYSLALRSGFDGWLTPVSKESVHRLSVS